jgi:PilZ domain
MEHRRHVRFPVRFRSSFRSANTVSGEGAVHDFSIRGCCVSSRTEVKPGTILQLWVEATDDESPIQVAQAVVRWFRAGRFGCEFVNLSQDEWGRLQRVIQDLEKEPYERHQDGTDAA